MSWFKKDKTKAFDDRVYNYVFNNIFDEQFSYLLYASTMMRKSSDTKSIVILFNNDEAHICEFKNKQYLLRFFELCETHENVSKAYNLVKKEYKNSITIDGILDNINIGGLNSLSKDELVYLIKNNNLK